MKDDAQQSAVGTAFDDVADIEKKRKRQSVLAEDPAVLLRDVEIAGVVMRGDDLDGTVESADDGRECDLRSRG